jgi:cell division protein FtsN
MSYRVDFDRDDDPRAARRHGPLVALAALVVMGASAGGVWAGWRILTHHGASAVVPVLHADERPVKVPPANPGGMKVPDQNIYILNDTRPTDARVEQLLPPPERPLPRPAPPPPAETQPAAPAAAPAPVEPAAPASAVPAAPLPAAPAVAPAAAPTSAAAAGYRLQLGALRSAEAAQHEWARIKRTQHDVLGPLEAHIVRADLGARGVFYRIELGPIDDAAAAESACRQLKQRKVGCILVRP